MSGTRATSTTSRRELSSCFFFSLKGKAPKEIHAILTETLVCSLPGRAKDLSAPLYNDVISLNKCCILTVIGAGKINDRFPYLHLTIPIFRAEKNTLIYINRFEKFCSFVKVSFWQFTLVAM